MTPADFQHLCRLARLAPDEADREHIAAQCSAILAYMDQLAEVDTAGVEPLYSPTAAGAEAVLPPFGGCGSFPARPHVREDRAGRTRSREEILANAPESDGVYFTVPRIVEGK